MLQRGLLAGCCEIGAPPWQPCLMPSPVTCCHQMAAVGGKSKRSGGIIEQNMARWCRVLRPCVSFAGAHLVGSVAHVPAGQVDVLVAAGGGGQLEHGTHADAPAVVVNRSVRFCRRRSSGMADMREQLSGSTREASNASRPADVPGGLWLTQDDLGTQSKAQWKSHGARTWFQRGIEMDCAPPER